MRRESSFVLRARALLTEAEELDHNADLIHRNQNNVESVLDEVVRYGYDEHQKLLLRILRERDVHEPHECGAV